VFRKYDAAGSSSSSGASQGARSITCRGLPTKWPTRQTSEGELPLVTPTIRTAAVDRGGNLWIAFVVPTPTSTIATATRSHRQFRAAGIMRPNSLFFGQNGRVLVTPGLYEFDGRRAQSPPPDLCPATGLTRRFGLRTVVNDVTFEVDRGEIVALLGPNGAGKTTTLRMLAGLIAPTSGTVAIDGMQLTRATGSTLRSRIGFLTEAPGLWDRLTVRENLRIYAGLYGLANVERTIDRALETFELTGRASRRPPSCRRARARRWHSRARCCTSRPSSCSTNRPRGSTRR
jgi:ABC-type multidrug transport system fused ATPase/permease subunit